jgi:anti-sigma factor RsiW
LVHCSEIAPLLSAFSDGELSPLETDQVTLHLDNCETCRDTLLDFVLLGHHLRTAVAMPSVEGFADAVMEGVGGSRRPLRERILYWLDELRERWVAAVSLTGAAIATATLLLVLAAPQTVDRISALVHGSPNRTEIVQRAPVNAPSLASAPAVAPSDSETYISRLESRHPDVATWSEPDNKTTVIWLGDDSSGNE